MFWENTDSVSNLRNKLTFYQGLNAKSGLLISGQNMGIIIIALYVDLEDTKDPKETL